MIFNYFTVFLVIKLYKSTGKIYLLLLILNYIFFRNKLFKFINLIIKFSLTIFYN